MPGLTYKQIADEELAHSTYGTGNSIQCMGPLFPKSGCPAWNGNPSCDGAFRPQYHSNSKYGNSPSMKSEYLTLQNHSFGAELPAVALTNCSNMRIDVNPIKNANADLPNNGVTVKFSPEVLLQSTRSDRRLYFNVTAGGLCSSREVITTLKECLLAVQGFSCLSLSIQTAYSTADMQSDSIFENGSYPLGCGLQYLPEYPSSNVLR